MSSDETDAKRRRGDRGRTRWLTLGVALLVLPLALLGDEVGLSPAATGGVLGAVYLTLSILQVRAGNTLAAVGWMLFVVAVGLLTVVGIAGNTLVLAGFVACLLGGGALVVWDAVVVSEREARAVEG
ncbi:hypothetical protein [Halomarina ordinaria]|uniref:SPW repeat protein n=1 Tax=Halomarina ordinaria TaxID=3033939 RepID=A0ABD5U375_9EURY|nr:hypothetical protein [Halomarina sp. PSRA2]